MTRKTIATGRRQRGLAIAAALAALTVGAAFAGEPALREAVEVDGADVTLGDLFTNAGDLAAVPVLRAPPPGETIRLSIADAFALANRHGFGWRPVAPFEFATVTRATRMLDQGRALDVLRAALERAGAGENLKIDLPPGALDLEVARGAIAEIGVEELTRDAGSGRFRAVLSVRDGTGPARRLTLLGTAHAYVEVPVLRARLRRDHVIEDADIAWASLRADRVPESALRDPLEIVGLSPGRMVPPGKPLVAADLVAPTIVAKGALVSMRLTTERMDLVAIGRAMESGALGDVIQVRNIQSRLVVEAVVTGPDRVSVRPGTRLIANR